MFASYFLSKKRRDFSQPCYVDRKFKTFFHFIEMNFNGNITLVACQVKVIQKNGTADCE
jgi:hypothetical protein